MDKRTNYVISFDAYRKIYSKVGTHYAVIQRHDSANFLLHIPTASGSPANKKWHKILIKDEGASAFPFRHEKGRSRE